VSQQTWLEFLADESNPKKIHPGWSSEDTEVSATIKICNDLHGKSGKWM
jgi:hypothetical protein